MAITLADHGDRVIQFDEFLQLVDETYDELSVDELIDVAPHFAALSRNASFLEDMIISELKNFTSFQESSPYSAQSLNLGGVEKKFYLRANVWLPKRELHTINGEGEADLYSYDFAHDHNFDFLTVGYFGSGYETDIYEYDAEQVRGDIGEVVDMKFLESTTLPRGKMMIYRASKDIHVQKFPEEFSISLNLLTPGRAPVADQLSFDLRTRTISSVVRSNYLGRSLLIDAAAALGNSEIDDVITFIARRHVCNRTRHMAHKALARSRSLPERTLSAG